MIMIKKNFTQLLMRMDSNVSGRIEEWIAAVFVNNKCPTVKVCAALIIETKSNQLLKTTGHY